MAPTLRYSYMGRFRRTVRAQEWGHFLVVAVRGELNATNGEELKEMRARDPRHEAGHS